MREAPLLRTPAPGQGRRGQNAKRLPCVALAHPLGDAATAAAAERTDGGAATQHELVKINKCGSAFPPSGKFAPFIVDTYGALGKAAVAALTQLIPLFARRLGVTYVVAARIAYGRITGAVIRGVARPWLKE